MEVHRKEFRLELSYDPGIPLLGIYLKSARTPTGKDIYIPVFTAALLNTAKASRPPGRPVGEWIRGGGTWNTALPQNKAETCIVTAWMPSETPQVEKDKKRIC